jgi:NAD(P)-dependent dehydrogenase (short-subunit alcohol dehydrogenase family)/acyl carrier protein
VSERAYTVNPQRSGDYDKLLGSLSQLNETPERIVHLWSIMPASKDHDDGADAQQARGFYSLIYLAQALALHAANSRCHVEIVSNNLHDVTGGEMYGPARSTILGPARVIPQEFPHITCRNLDVWLPVSGQGMDERLPAQLISELFAPATDAPVAFRGGHRWTQIVEPLRLDKRGSRLREGGSYLITGGLSGFGLACANYLAETARARLTLTSDDYFPERYEWQQWLAAHDEKDEVSRKILEVYALEEKGAEVLVMALDVTSQAQMQILVTQAQQRFGNLNGVINARETYNHPRLIREKSAAEAARVLDSRIKAAATLHAVLPDTPLDFLVHFSSAQALNNTLGQVDACAGDAFLDACAHDDAMAHARFTTTIDWGLRQWAEPEDSSLPGLSETQAEIGRSREAYGLTLADGVKTLDRVLSHALPQVIVSKIDYRLVAEQRRAFTNSIDVQRLGSTISNSSATTEPEACAVPSNQTEKTLARIWQDVLGIERVGIHDNFFELGGNSLVGIQLMSRLRREFMLDLPMSSLFASPTVAGLAACVSASLLEKEDAEELERMIAEIESLSPADLGARIAAATGADK